MSPLTPLQREEPPQSSSSYIPRKSSPGSTSTAATSSTYENHNPQQESMMGRQQASSPRESPELTIRKMRAALEESKQRDASAKASLAKSDSVILELRSSIRQLKRQVEQVQVDKEGSVAQVEKLQREMATLENTAAHSLQEKQHLHQEQVTQLKEQLVMSETQAKEEMVGELQVQLDRAHAQILTADMVRKELEDTLEAEQYTWELRVQDQERQLTLMQEECKQLEDDLTECRTQWREAEELWSKEVKELQEQSRDGSFVGKIRQLEKEREELQGCLDEAMKELEAVDKELRENPNVLEPLQHLYRWLLERNGVEDQDVPADAHELVQRIETMIEDSPHDSLKVAELEAQLSVYRGDLKAREESSAELRASLKEAVALLKPLQDAVAKTDREKKELEDELENLQKDHEELEEKVKLSPVISPRSLTSVTKSMPSGEEQEERGSARSKRNKAQESLQKMLSTAQNRFQELNHGNSEVVEQNEELTQRVKDLEEELLQRKSVDDQESLNRDVAAEMREAAVQQLQEDVKAYSQELERKEKDIEKMHEELQQARDSSTATEDVKWQVEELEREVESKRTIEKQLKTTKQELLLKSEAERMLNESLKEALGLLKPLQLHLETAEREKKALSKQLKSSRRKLARAEATNEARSYISSEVPSDQQSDLEVVVQELQHENAQLRPRQSRLEANLVEAQSRHEVTEGKLESATVENHALVDALKQKEQAEQKMSEELKVLRRKLEKSEHELENAKYIATSALMKVEELTMAGISGNVSRNIAQDSGKEDKTEARRLQHRLATLQNEVESTRELNESLEESIQERDRMLHALAQQQGEKGPSPRRRVQWEA